ncbi:MAG: hypothetical protein AMJ59_06630 [Gammaproteobacteria bacterium SG8_31]|jgi:hypothetical protein|nr:MAG: hypothetical protein AMJ59_06630 [Gammaproteobacteria bacterium SG8_31]
MIENIVIDPRFRGPPRSGNGGYVCGLLGRFYTEPATVTLRRPPPLGIELTLAGHGTKHLRLLREDELIAESEPGRLDLDIPKPPDFDTAVEASQGYIGFAEHHFGGCFVCGPDRGPGDGLRIFAGDVPGRPLVAAPWTPDSTLAGDDDRVKPEFLWAALDCPGYFALHTDRSPSLMLLGRFAARVEPILRTGERCVVVGWGLGADGRKHYAGTAIFAESGALIGEARATWIEVDQALW